MKSLLNIRLVVSVHLLIVVLVICIGAWSVYAAKNQLREVVLQNIDREVSIIRASGGLRQTGTVQMRWWLRLFLIVQIELNLRHF